MSLRLQAAADCLGILENETDFGWQITVTSPTGATLAMVGMSTDIGLSIDPQTGAYVSTRKASIALPIKRLEDASMGLPQGAQDRLAKPWVIEFADVHGRPHTFRVVESHPDRALGVVTCMLDQYQRKPDS